MAAIKKESAYQLMFKDYPDIVDAAQMSEMLGINIKTGYALLKSGKIKNIRVGREYKIPKLFIFHDLRHSCASLLLANGVSLKDIQSWLGHSTISTTANIYVHQEFASKISSANAILQILPGTQKEA